MQTTDIVDSGPIAVRITETDAPENARKWIVSVDRELHIAVMDDGGACHDFLMITRKGAATSQIEFRGRVIFEESSPPHADERAVDRFACALKEKLANKRDEGYGGWDDPREVTIEELYALLVNEVAGGDGDAVDVGNFAMMIWNRAQWLKNPTHNV